MTQKPLGSWPAFLERMRLRLRLLGSPGLLWTWLTSANPIRPWRDDPELRAAIDSVSSHTLVSPVRRFLLLQLSRQCRTLPGDVAEIGVYKGGTARLLAESLKTTGKRLHLFDTFSGMPSTDEAKDWHKEGDFGAVSLASVREYLSGEERVTFYPGFFPETAGPIESTTFCLVHVDVDIYRSVLDACRFFYPRLVRAGVMIFDDYGFLTCPGAKAAVDEFFADKPERPCYLPTGQCLVIKL
jgi:O-methyltransferase